MTFSKKHKNTATSPADAETAAPAADSAPKPDAAETPPQAANGPAPEAAPPETTAPPPPPVPSEADAWKERLLRLQADFDNYRKRMVRDREDTVARANADLLAELLIPIDHMDRAIATMGQSAGDDDPCVQGVRMVRTELLAVLERFGLASMDVEGKAFDPALHEALGWTPAPGIAEGHIAVQVRAGYLLNGRVLRAAQVMLAGQAAESTEGTEA